ncbi:hypothetical protein CJD36_008685 [Flavipsychrobacter stenotrophus]|uniref:Terminase ATPase subunit N-terminal domain-containing protein n=1 Tax=Flavipsychrobacter stenotrophus TaxID=2077091 RepID=A0A2S7SY51_9BACT|nr:hypothetical protein [Flavipsychrobacter stenotrophus]PQJ11860.1 hypothetical protein CJD36_008685 [Flavipsychrobacter stenotrophus]
MENNNEKKQAARNLFLHSDRTRAEIADLIDINTKTLYLWIKHGRWEQMKTAARQTPASLLQDVYDHIEAVNNKIKAREDRCPTYQEVEMLRKLFASTKHIQKLNIGTYIEAFTELTSFINDHDSELGKAVVTLTDKYIRGLVSPFHPTAYKNVCDVKDNLEAIQQEEEKEMAELQQAEAPLADHEANKVETNTAIIIPLTPNHETQTDNTILPQSTPHLPTNTAPQPRSLSSHPLFKSTPSFFTRPPLAVPPDHLTFHLRYHMIGRNRAFLHYISHSKPTNNPNPMPDENLNQTGHNS